MLAHIIARWAFPAVLCGISAHASCAFGDVLFESGTLGQTGLSRGDVPGANVSDAVFNGVRFELTGPVVTSRVGGHFVDSSGTTDTLFGAIVKLDDGSDYPDSGDLSTPDVLGATVISFPAPSAEVFGDLSLSLDSGWYALVFGGGLFGANGAGAMPLNNPDIGDPTYIGFQPLSGVGWIDLKVLNRIFRDYRFVIHGHFVPEPALFGQLVTAVYGFLLVRRMRDRNRR